MAVGYATLYGDMAGGFAPIKDCPKRLVYRLAGYRNGSYRNGFGPHHQRVLNPLPCGDWPSGLIEGCQASGSPGFGLPEDTGQTPVRLGRNAARSSALPDFLDKAWRNHV